MFGFQNGDLKNIIFYNYFLKIVKKNTSIFASVKLFFFFLLVLEKFTSLSSFICFQKNCRFLTSNRSIYIVMLN